MGICCIFFEAELNKNPPEGVSVGLADDDNMFIWELLIVGPPDTVRSGHRNEHRCRADGIMEAQVSVQMMEFVEKSRSCCYSTHVTCYGRAWVQSWKLEKRGIVTIK